MFSALLSLALVALCAQPISAHTYRLQDNYVGRGFLSGFQHQAIPDPTHGRVNYVDQGTALSRNLTYASQNSFVMRADSTTRLDANGPGRNSVRIKSNKSYNTHVAVFDIRHMPVGCATWPAAWEVKEGNWPNGGEVDILEGVNDVSPNRATLHTSAGCTIPQNPGQTGTTASTNCDVAANSNEGCGVMVNKPNSYGQGFNNVGGGIYVMERRNEYIRVFFWPRNDGSLPQELRYGALQVNTDNWGTPVALFPNTQCNLASKFQEHNIIINLTLCGDWAGQQSIFNNAGCPGACADYVNNNPQAFRDAYWDIAAVRVYV